MGGGYPSAWQVSCIVADSIFETSDEGFLVKIGRPNGRKVNMMSSEKAIMYLFLPVFQTTQNRRISLEKKYLCEFSRRVPVDTTCVSRENNIQVVQLVRIMVRYICQLTSFRARTSLTCGTKVPYNGGGDARRFVWVIKLKILVSSSVLRTKRQNFYPFRV